MVCDGFSRQGARQLAVQRQSPESTDRSRLVRWRDLANDEILDNKGRSREPWPTARQASGVSERVVPEGAPQRLCPHSPVPLKNGGLPRTKSNAMLASTMQ
jgi:hypothetical protein